MYKCFLVAGVVPFSANKAFSIASPFRHRYKSAVSVIVF